MDLPPFFERLSTLRTRIRFLRSLKKRATPPHDKDGCVTKVAYEDHHHLLMRRPLPAHHRQEQKITREYGVWVLSPTAGRGGAAKKHCINFDQSIKSGETISVHTAMALAVISDDSDTLKWLMDVVLPIELTTSLERCAGAPSLMLVSLGLGHLECAQALYAAVPTILALRDQDELSALHYASFGGRIDVYKWVAERFHSSRGHPLTVTPAMAAAVSDRTDLLRWLADKDATHITACDSENFSIAHYAAGAGACRALAVLKEHNVELILPPKDTKISTLMVAAFFGELSLPRAFKTLYPQELALALMEGDINGRLALHYAVWGRIPETIDFFCKLVLPDFEAGVHLLLDACEQFNCLDVFKAVMKRFPEYQPHFATWVVENRAGDLLKFMETTRRNGPLQPPSFAADWGSMPCDEAFPLPGDGDALLIQYYSDFLQEGISKWLAAAKEPTPRWLDLPRQQFRVR